MRAQCLLLFLSIQCLQETISLIDKKPSTKPHIIHIIADDLGWAELGYHNTLARSLGQIKTPVIDDLIKNEALELDRFYAEKICSPSRSSFQTGRLGIHVNTQNVAPNVHNLKDPVGGYQGAPLGMSTVAEVLQSAGYSTHLVGKWDVGMATPQHSPTARGYSTFLGYFHHANDYWSMNEGTCSAHFDETSSDNSVGESSDASDLSKPRAVKDLWRSNATYDGPAFDLENGPSCSQSNQSPGGEVCRYEDDIFVKEVLSIISTHEASIPLFLVYSMHLTHFPLEAPQSQLDTFAFVDSPLRQRMSAMTNLVDQYVGQVVASLRASGLWNNTLLVFHGDNGGEIIFGESCAGNNYPLRGGKFSHWEGGIRCPAFVTGGYLPQSRRGQKSTSLVHVADWYATYADLAGARSIKDEKAALVGLPPLDSLSCWGMISGEGDAVCRSEVPVGDTSAVAFDGDGQALVGALIQGEYKIVLGAANKGFHVDQDVTTGPLFPNKTDILLANFYPRVCNRDPMDQGCLYNIFDDPSESINLAAEKTELFNQMLARLDEIQLTTYSPDRGQKSPRACEAASKRGFYWGPFLAASDV